MDLFESELCAIVLLGVGSVIFGLLPGLFKERCNQRPLLMSSLLCFGGGVLLATSFVHMLPEVREELPKEYREYTEVIFCLGFFILYMLDELVHICYGETGGHGHLDHSHESKQHKSDHTSANYGSLQGSSNPLMPKRPPPYNPEFYHVGSENESLVTENTNPSQMCHVGHQEPCKNTLPIANIGLLIALSTHSLLEGLIIGLEDSSSKVLLLLGAVSCHKLVISFCLGVELVSSPYNTFCRHLASILIFASGPVIGIIAGMFITNMPEDVTTLATPILQGLAGGTLLYVTVSEVLPRERARWHQEHSRRFAGLYQFVSVCLGFVVMVMLTRYTE